jgi:hypothetical protein
MLFSIILLHILAISQIGATAVGPASWVVLRIVLYLVDVNSEDPSLKKRTEMWVDIKEKETNNWTTCFLRTQFPPSSDEWSFCAGGQFYIRARGLSRSTEIEYDLDIVKMSSDRLGCPYTNSRLKYLPVT